MDLKRIFLSHNVIVRSEADTETDGELCFVSSVTGQELTLVTAEEEWRSRPPEKGDAIVIRSNRMEATYIVSALVTACEHRTDDTGECMLRIHARKTGNVLRIQRRDNFRVRIQMPVDIKAPRMGIVKPVTLMTHDLSAGGLRITSKEALDVGSVLSVSLHLPDEKPAVNCGSEVVRCEPEGDDTYELAMALKRLRPSDEDRIVQVLTKVIRDSLQAMRDQG